jgi:hypothetical protein
MCAITDAGALKGNSMSEDVLIQKCRDILARLRPEGRTPMMRFIFRDWTRADYEALDCRLAACEVGTSRYVLPDDEGILVGSAGWTIAPLVRR